MTLPLDASENSHPKIMCSNPLITNFFPTNFFVIDSAGLPKFSCT